MGTRGKAAAKMMDATQQDDYQPDEDQADDGGLDNEVDAAANTTKINFGKEDGETIKRAAKMFGG